MSGTEQVKIQKARPVGLPPVVRIQLEDSESIPPTGLFLGVNGASYMLRAGVPVNVPKTLTEILDNAVMSVPVRDPQTQQVIGYRDRKRYPYSILPPEEATETE